MTSTGCFLDKSPVTSIYCASCFCFPFSLGNIKAGRKLSDFFFSLIQPKNTPGLVQSKTRKIDIYEPSYVGSDLLKLKPFHQKSSVDFLHNCSLFLFYDITNAIVLCLWNRFARFSCWGSFVTSFTMFAWNYNGNYCWFRCNSVILPKDDIKMYIVNQDLFKILSFTVSRRLLLLATFFTFFDIYKTINH